MGMSGGTPRDPSRRSFLVLDQRQYAEVPPCRADVEGDFGDCAERTGTDRAHFGEAQEH